MPWRCGSAKKAVSILALSKQDPLHIDQTALKVLLNRASSEIFSQPWLDCHEFRSLRNSQARAKFSYNMDLT
jgi:hypothetical protein